MSTRGSALVLVILALALLLSLGVPFLMSGKMRSEAARNGFARAEVRTAVDSASQLGLHHAGGSHPSLDPDPLWDAESEWNPKALGPLPMSLSSEWKDSKHVWGIEMSPVQGKISLATASPTLLQNLLHPCYITTDTDYRAVELPVTSTEGFAESGLLFIGGRWIQYAGKTASSFTGVVPALEEETPDDLASTRFWEGFVVLDPRVWNLAFARLQSGKHRPPEFFEDMLSQDITGSGPLAPEDVRLLERLTWLDTGRYGQADFGPAVWLTRLINPNSPDVLHVSDSSGFSMGTLARLEPEQGDPFEMYVMGTSVSGGRLRMSSPIPDDFEPFTTRVYPLMREPVDLNSASSEVLKALVAGLRWRNRPSMPLDQANPPSGNWRRDWVHPSQATRFAERVVRARPLKGPDDLWDRVLGPMAQDNHLSDYEAWAIFLNGLNADSGELRHTTAPFGYRTGDRYLQRVNASVRSRLGARLADQSARELVRAAPPGPALRMFPTQADYDDVARWARGAQGVLSLPWNLGSVGGLHQPRTQMGLRVGIWNPAGRVRPGGMDELTGLMPVPAREADSFGPNTSGKTEHFDWEVSPFGRDLGARGPWTSQLYEWGIIGNDAIYST
ncbi:MAG: hypothetical protein MK213_04060, partial [Planctomycetes bacterium]|nr:hypothetical protein [Planctomycetota bacterium]